MQSQLNASTGQLEQLILTNKILLQHFDPKPTTLPSEDDGGNNDPFVGDDDNEYEYYNDKEAVAYVSVDSLSS